MDEVFYERAMDIYDILVQANEPKDRGDFYLDFYLDNPFRPDNDPVYPFSENDIEKVKSSFGYHFIFVTNQAQVFQLKQVHFTNNQVTLQVNTQ